MEINKKKITQTIFTLTMTDEEACNLIKELSYHIRGTSDAPAIEKFRKLLGSRNV